MNLVVKNFSFVTLFLQNRDKVNLIMYYCYILKSITTDKLYIGYCADLKSRLKRHNKGLVQATKAFTPYDLIFYSAFRNKSDALAAEKYYKTTAGWKRIHKMLENELNQ